jgi:hypothetical protein
VTTPAHAAGWVHVRVVTTHGTSPTGSADRFRFVAPPSVASLSPATGPTTGGTTVTIAGGGFESVHQVLFGSTPATSMTVTSTTFLQVVSPANVAGAVDVRVVTAYGTSAVAPADRFTYTP